ncbi:iron-sulfur cluster assembly 2 homolog, mitochondrial-like isoform X2 [Rhopilema esculentum]|uniref:iron-sulfur cluster assembly 2 homolog, mitochondrial-like isoform X2 n=1 Tax=Rhopilema esculentum TaxID=499914 RepID=UPI0031DDB6D6
MHIALPKGIYLMQFRQLQKILEGEEFLRVVIEGGGCAGFQYKFEVDKDIHEDDKVFQEDGAKVVVDIDSLGLIKGSSIDYQVEMIKASFVVLKNPNVEKGCSCGTSFSIKI